MLRVKAAIVPTIAVCVGFASFARAYVTGDASFLSPFGYSLPHAFAKPLSVFRAGCRCWATLTSVFVFRGVACTSVNSPVVSRTDVSLGFACVFEETCRSFSTLVFVFVFGELRVLLLIAQSYLELTYPWDLPVCLTRHVVPFPRWLSFSSILPNPLAQFPVACRCSTRFPSVVV